MKNGAAWLLAVLIALAAGAGGGYWYGSRHAGGEKEAEPTTEPSSESAEEKPVAPVVVEPIRRATISEQVTAYGSVVAPASEVRVVSVPFEARVVRLLVTPGQPVAAGQALIRVEGSAATALAVEEARNAASAAERDLQLVRQRYEQKLATNAELYAAENALRTAQGKAQSFKDAGGGPRELKSDVAGLVSKVDVQPGQVVPAGGPLVEVAAENQIEVRLGVEPADAPSLKPGQPVRLRRVSDGDAGGGEGAVAGKVRLVARRVDPASRLIDVMVALPPDAGLVLEEAVVGQFTRASAADALVVPRGAVLPAAEGDAGFVLFTVKDGKAVRHAVRVGIENGQDVQVIADDLAEGQPAVTVGNFELEDGMAVEAHAPAATTAKSSSEAEAPTSPAATRAADRTEGRP